MDSEKNNTPKNVEYSEEWRERQEKLADAIYNEFMDSSGGLAGRYAYARGVEDLDCGRAVESLDIEVADQDGKKETLQCILAVGARLVAVVKNSEGAVVLRNVGDKNEPPRDILEMNLADIPEGETKNIVVGRQDIDAMDDTISAEHFEIVVDKSGSIFINDGMSTNGTALVDKDSLGMGIEGDNNSPAGNPESNMDTSDDKKMELLSPILTDSDTWSNLEGSGKKPESGKKKETVSPVIDDPKTWSSLNREDQDPKPVDVIDPDNEDSEEGSDQNDHDKYENTGFINLKESIVATSRSVDQMCNNLYKLSRYSEELFNRSYVNNLDSWETTLAIYNNGADRSHFEAIPSITWRIQSEIQMIDSIMNEMPKLDIVGSGIDALRQNRFELLEAINRTYGGLLRFQDSLVMNSSQRKSRDGWRKHQELVLGGVSDMKRAVEIFNDIDSRGTSLNLQAPYDWDAKVQDDNQDREPTGPNQQSGEEWQDNEDKFKDDESGNENTTNTKEKEEPTEYDLLLGNLKESIGVVRWHMDDVCRGLDSMLNDAKGNFEQGSINGLDGWRDSLSIYLDRTGPSVETARNADFSSVITELRQQIVIVDKLIDQVYRNGQGSPEQVNKFYEFRNNRQHLIEGLKQLSAHIGSMNQVLSASQEDLNSGVGRGWEYNRVVAMKKIDIVLDELGSIYKHEKRMTPEGF
ncbi:hypothetical protein CR956_01500 [Candidatus Saccharibacteria bacterium]|nr:MAG: hypothetical protein CR956_01500 [Candidatus Saccharibacteria bacterium]